jgi:hypothetical protein
MARVSNWALKPRGLAFCRLGAVFPGGAEKFVSFSFTATHDTKRLEVHLSRAEAESLRTRLERMLMAVHEDDEL